MNRAPYGLLAVCAAVLVGCDNGPRDSVALSKAPATAAKTTLPKPDAYRISYDAGSRTLSLYDLPDDQARWMITSPRNAKGEPVSNGHTFTSDIDLDSVSVFYTTHGLASPTITLREVLTMQVAHGR